MTNMKLRYCLILIFLTPWLASCERLGLEDPAAEKAREEAEGKAIGSACRQMGRALEDCYQINRRAPKAAIFSGWRDMDAYMRENKIAEIKPDSSTNPPPETGQPLKAAEEATEPAQKNQTAAAKPEATKGERAAEAKPAGNIPANKSKAPLAH